MRQIKYQFYTQLMDGGYAIFRSEWEGDKLLRKRRANETIYTSAKAADRRLANLCGEARANGELRNA